MERRHQLGLDSYDRLFPSQDTMPKGGFGNLIALPLQQLPRSNGNSVFLDASFNPHPDQWTFLSSRIRYAEYHLQKWKTPCAMPSAAARIIGVQHSGV